MTPRGRVVISADDFGLTAGVNRAIVESLESGAVTSTALILGHPGTEEALTLASAMPGLDLGVHINLTDGMSVTRDPRLRPITDGNGAFAGRRSLLLASLLRQIDPAAVRAEVTAQIDVFHDRGLEVTHLDSHHYMHMVPGIVTAIGEVAAHAGVSLIRSSGLRSFLPGESAPGGDRTDQSPGLVFATDAVVPLGLPMGGVPNPVLRRFLRRTHVGAVEIVTHPGYVDDELATRSNYVEGREEELDYLASGKLRSMIDECHLVTSSFRELATTSVGEARPDAGASPESPPERSS